MKPLRIELQAFGSYPGKEVVDFTLLTQRGLFVITGETGTGKTTIFDAMCYALYGAMPSKEGNDIRSHHAASTTPTYVVFQFEVDGVTYSARREPAQERAAKRGGGIITEAAKAQLDRLDTKASLATRAGDVTQRCTELVGLKADQFQKVILLPQGEVAKFLVAGSKEREELLGQLFGGQVFDAIVDELRARERDLGTKVTKVNSDIDYALTTARQQVRRVHEVLELDTATDDNIDDTADDTAIRAALAAVQPVLDDVILRAAAATEQVQAATAAFEDAKAQAARFERAATLRATLDDLSERKPQVEADEQRGIRSRDARPLVAADDAFAGAARVQAAADAELAQRRDAITQAFAPLGMVPDITSATAVTAAVHQLQVDLQRQRGLLDAHHAAQQALAEAQQSHDALVAQLVDAQLELSGHHSAVQQLETLLPAALTLAADAPRLAEALTAVGTALTRRAQLDEAMEQWRAASATATQASSAFDDLLRRFDTTAAPRLAAALQPGQPCPVCGSAEHPQPSTATSDHTSDHTSDGLVSFDGIVSFDGLEHAAGARNATAQARQVVEAEVAGLRGALGADADTPTAELHTRQLELQQQHEAATAAQRRADDLTDALAAAHQAAEVAQLAQARLEVSITSALDTITSCTNAVATATAAAEGVDARGLDTQQVVLQAVEPLCDDLDGCFDRSITTAAAAAALAQQRDDTLASSPFQVIDDARAQLLDAAHESSVLEAATAWRDQVTTANGQLSELDQQGIPARAPDVEAADANATAVAQASSAVIAASTTATNAAGDCSAALMQHDALVANSGDLRVQHAAARKAFKVCNEGGALGMPLRRWVLAIELDRVTNAANVHLQRMTTSRYTLRRRHDIVDGRKAFGLDLEVVDAHTGRPRSTTSLSGGEQFQASLALALGLADVVSHGGGASGKRFEALFVDEGFGSLDPTALQEAIGALHQLQATGRMVGAITHVEAMKQDLHVGIQVSRLPDGKGSTLEVRP